MTDRKQPKPRRKRKLPTAESLAAYALFHLGRYAASEAGLRRVLENRIRRAGMDHPDFAADHESKAKLSEAIGSIIEKHRRLGTLNDEAFASMKASSMRRAGQSARLITQKLHVKGIAEPLTRKALEDIDEEQGDDAERKAARHFARKKKLGPYAPSPAEDLPREAAQKKRARDFAALARAGYSSSLIREILGGSLEDEVFDD